MARAYPRTLLDADVKTDSERKVFELLEASLPEEWEVFHSSSWVARDPAEGADSHEIDFVLCRPDEAVLCLEVKGGGIECRHGEWFRVTPGGKRERIKDPFQQALDNRFALERQLQQTAGWGKTRRMIVHAVAFPYLTIHQLALAPDAPRAILIDRHDLEDPTEAIEKVLAYHRGARDKRRAPGDDGAAALRELLAPTISIRVPMAAQFLAEEEALIHLTHDQSRLLTHVRHADRLVVRGCAGSGKTMLGVEHGRRLASEGKRVLFVCFNRALRDHLRATSRVDGLDIHNFHGLCFHLASRCGIKLSKHDGDPPPEFWNEELPDALVEAIDILGDQYDALIVDEAQDLATHWLTALMATLADERENPVWLFMDDNQRVYETQLEVPREFQPFDLTVNCRNTQAVHREVMKLYEGDIAPEVKGPEGRAVELHHTQDATTTVAGAISRLCGEEEVAPQDIVVLSSHGFANSTVAQTLPGEWRPTDERGKLGNYIYCSSIRAFKGLESPVVVLCELEDIDDMTINQQLYVAISRARNHCVIVAPPAAGE